MTRAPQRRRILAATALGLAALAAGSARASTDFFYDGNGRLVASTRDGEISETYSFDAADNRATLNTGHQNVATPNSGWLYPNQSLNRYQAATSGDNRFSLTLQNDGNVVLYFNGQGLWSTGTASKQSANFVMQGDGNLVLYDAYGNGLWSSGTGGHAGAQLAIQNDGNLVIYYNNTSLWSSNTGGH